MLKGCSMRGLASWFGCAAATFSCGLFASAARAETIDRGATSERRGLTEDYSRWRFQGDAGLVYLDSRYARFRGTVRNLGGGVAANFGLTRAVTSDLALGASILGSGAVASYALVDGYAASVQENALWLGSIGPLVEYRVLPEFHLTGAPGFALTYINARASRTETAPGVGLSLGAIWDINESESTLVSLLARAVGTQTWADNTRISALAAGFFVQLSQPRGP